MSENIQENHETSVFISYSRKDKAFVQKIHSGIASAGFKTWVDWEGIELTTDWWHEIQRGIEDADAFAFIISPDSLASKVCYDEIQWAVNNNKRLIPILHREPDEENELHPQISSHNWVFMRDEAELEANLPQMLKVINLNLEWVRNHTRYQKRALQWQNRDHSNSYLLRGEDLLAAEAWLAEGSRHAEQQPTDLQIEYIQAGRTYETKRQRQIRMISGAAILIFLAITIFAVIQFFSADSARDTAVAAQATAEAERALAEAAQQLAETQEAIASQNEALALTREAEAAAAQDVAERNETLANARLLVSEGQSIFQKDPMLSMALIAEGIMLAETLDEAETVLGSSQGQVFQWGREDLLTAMVSQAYSDPAGNWLLFNYEELPAQIFDTADFSVKTEFDYDLQAWEPSPNETTALATYFDAPSELRELVNGTVIAELPEGLESWLFSPEGSKLLLNPFEGPSLLYDASGGSLVDELGGFAISAKFSPDGRRLFTLSEDIDQEEAVYHLVNTDDGSTLLEIEDELLSSEFSLDGNWLFLNYAGNVSELRNATDGSLVTPVMGELRGWDFSPNSDTVFFAIPQRLGGLQGELRSTADGRVIASFDATANWGFNPDGSLLLVNAIEEGGRLVDTTTGQVAATIPDDFVRWEFSPSHDLLVIHSFEEPGELRQARDGSLITELPAPLLHWEFSPSGNYLVLNYDGAPGELRDVATNTVIAETAEDAMDWEFSPEETMLVVNYRDDPPELLSTADGSLIAELPIDGEKWSFSADESWLIVTKKSGNSEIWNAKEGYSLAPLDANVAQIFFIMPTQTAVVHYQDGDTYLLNLPWLEAMQASGVLEETDPASIRELIDLVCQYPLADSSAYEADLQQYLTDFDINASLACQ